MKIPCRIGPARLASGTGTGVDGAFTSLVSTAATMERKRRRDPAVSKPARASADTRYTANQSVCGFTTGATIRIRAKNAAKNTPAAWLFPAGQVEFMANFEAT